MKNILLAVLVFCAAQAASATEAILSGDVTRIDAAARQLKVEDVAGNTTVIRVPPTLEVFDRLKTGDRLYMIYTKPVALAIGRIPAETTPAALDVTARIEDVDRGARELRLRAPDDSTLRLEVPAGTPGFETARVGETVPVRYVEAVAVAIREPMR
ncbi:MAG: hypothetical protein HYZ75_01205 [Elusimicrobia bacterium]|nr:hypothetical protein [Elusimicrobiota bacterium]